MIKILVDRKEPDSHSIKNRQDFQKVLKMYEKQIRLFYNPWFYGAVGFSSLLLFLLNYVII
ncbi:MAG: hypothetical protein FJY17_06225 [Bacteroidetes bacterium]|nr:hypothetical protein [Bacteroidota bacterium]